MNWHNMLRTNESGWTILVRLLVGLCVFLPEGIQKLLFADVLETVRKNRHSFSRRHGSLRGHR
jgi:hypothetical protein